MVKLSLYCYKEFILLQIIHIYVLSYNSKVDKCLFVILKDGGDWETDHEKYAQFDEHTKIKCPDGTVSFWNFFYFISYSSLNKTSWRW